MASAISNMILLKTNEETGKRPTVEAIANVAITPGELIEVLTDGEVDPHGTALGIAEPLWAEVNQFDGDSSTTGLDTDYAIGDTVFYHRAQKGDEINAFIEASAVLVKGVTRLVSDGLGALQAAASVDATLIANSVVAIANETVTIGGARARANVKVV